MRFFAAVANRLTRVGGTLRKMTFNRSPWRMLMLPSSRFDYAGAVGDGTGSSTVAAVLNWIARTFPEAPPALWKEDAYGQEEQILHHPMLHLLRKPNDYYTGLILWMATVVDYVVDGNAYWLKIRDQLGEVVQLWWVPHWMMEPRGDETTLITHYDYTPNSEPVRISSDDVVHFRFGLDPNDPKKGYSQLKSVLREVFTDDEAANFTASLLRNMGVPGLVISPEKGTVLNPSDADAMKEYVREKFGGDKRGEAMVMTGPTQIEQFGFSPDQLNLRDLRRIPEERVSAATGIPAIVVGFGAGLERSTFTNMGEARAAAYEAGLIPTQRILSEEVLFQLLTDFEPDVFTFRFAFDLRHVRVLQEDLYRLVQRHDLAVRGGWEKVSEARRALGLTVDPAGGDDVYLRMLNIYPAASGDTPPPANPGVNGAAANGHQTPELTAAAVVAALERRDLLTTA